MNVSWSAKANGNFTLQKEQTTATMQVDVHYLSRMATITIGSRCFTLRQTGFWKTKCEIRDSNQNIIAKISPQSRNDSSWQIDYKKSNYKVLLRNNPLAEFVITQNNAEILAYGLDSSDNVLSTRIKENTGSDIMLHCILWYFFLPVANENMGMSLFL
jgi:hypothetical protein